MKKIKNPWREKGGYDCFGCSPDNPIGLHMEFFEDGDDIVCFWCPQQHYQGWINTMHGGIISTLIDEIAGWTVMRKLQATGVTGKLEVAFKKPVMTTELQITLRAHIVKQVRNIAVIAVTLEDGQGVICDEGTAIYFMQPEERAREMGFMGCDVEAETFLSM